MSAGGDSGTGSLSSGSSDGSGPVTSAPLTLTNGGGGGGGGSGARGSGGSSGGHVVGIGPEGTPVAASTSTQHSAAHMVRCFSRFFRSIFHLSCLVAVYFLFEVLCHPHANILPVRLGFWIFKGKLELLCRAGCDCPSVATS